MVTPIKWVDADFKWNAAPPTENYKVGFKPSKFPYTWNDVALVEEVVETLIGLDGSFPNKVVVGTTTLPSPGHQALTVVGNISGSGNLKIDGSQVDFTNLPTSDPGVAGRLWNDSNTLKISL